MGRKTKITKEMILEAAFGILDESGIGSVAIKQIAAGLECSTQPISWHFGSMVELRKALYIYASQKMFSGLEENMKKKDAMEAFFFTGLWYLSIAFDHPHVFRFLNVDDPSETIGEDIYGDTSIFSMQFDKEAVKVFSEQYDIAPGLIAKMVRDTVIYTHGLALMVIFDRFKLPKKEACRMMFDAGITFASSLGIKTEFDFDRLYKSSLRIMKNKT